MTRRRKYRPLPEPGLFPIRTSGGDYRAWSFRDCLKWAADEHGILRHDRLRLIREARGYQRGWVDHINGRHWEEVWAESTDWWARRNRR
jgi:hypothetical protein